MAPLSEPQDTTATDVALSKWNQAFEAVLRQILEDYEGTEANIRDGMESGMRKLFEKAYHEELSGGDSTFSLDDARRVMFFPMLTDMRRYVDMFARETPESTARKERVMKFKMMSVFYTLHRKDGALMDRFIHYGGLDALVAILGEDNRVIQSQAVELFLEMVSPMIQQTELPPTASSRMAHVHHQLYACMTSSDFWKNISRIIAEPHEVFPKSHASCIRILAGAVGWLRPPGASPVGGPEPGVALATYDAKDALQDFLSSDVYRGSMPDVRGLAEDLLQELQEGALCRHDPVARSDLAEIREDIFDPGAEAREAASHAWQSLKQMANEAFKAGLVWPAEACYRLALTQGGAAVPTGEASRIESNRSLVLLRAGHYADAAAAAAAALESDPRNSKAAFRRATALLELSSGSSASSKTAAAFATDALSAAELAAQLEPNDTKVADVLDQARRRAQELAPVEVAADKEAEAEILDAMD